MLTNSTPSWGETPSLWVDSGGEDGVVLGCSNTFVRLELVSLTRPFGSRAESVGKTTTGQLKKEEIMDIERFLLASALNIISMVTGMLVAEYDPWYRWLLYVVCGVIIYLIATVSG